MGAITSPTIIQLAPNCGVKEVVVTGSMATGETWDASSYFTTLYVTYLCDGTGAVKIATFSGTTVTMGTLSTGTHTLIVWGI